MDSTIRSITRLCRGEGGHKGSVHWVSRVYKRTQPCTMHYGGKRQRLAMLLSMEEHLQLAHEAGAHKSIGLSQARDQKVFGATNIYS